MTEDPTSKMIALMRYFEDRGLVYDTEEKRWRDPQEERLSEALAPFMKQPTIVKDA